MKVLLCCAGGLSSSILMKIRLFKSQLPCSNTTKLILLHQF